MQHIIEEIFQHEGGEGNMSVFRQIGTGEIRRVDPEYKKSNCEDWKMAKISTIVVPVDFLKSADKLIKYAAYMAQELSANIHFIHVVELYSGDAMLGAPHTHEYRELFLSDAKLRMTNLVADYKDKIPGCTGDVLFGDPVDKIVEYAKDKSADLIIISTHGARGLEKILLGSVAERVLKNAHCPVLIMNPFKK